MKAKTTSLLCAVLLLGSCASYKHHYSHSLLSRQQTKLIDEAIAGIAENNTLPQMDVWGSTYYPNESQLLNRLLAIEDLDSLARNHPSPAVRATTGIILIERAPRAAKHLLTERLTDTSSLTTRSYGFCIVLTSGNTVGNIMLNYALEHNLFSREELASLDSTILATPACRHLNRHHKLTGTPIPREAFQKIMYGHPWRSPAFQHDLLTDTRRISDTTLFYSQIKQFFHLDGQPKCYLLDAYMRPSWKGYTLSQIYIDGTPGRLALLLIDGKYDIVDTLTITEPIKVQPLSETDTMHICTYFKLPSKPVMQRNELTVRKVVDGTDTLEYKAIIQGYDIEPGRGFVYSGWIQTVDYLRKTNTTREAPTCDPR